jgi:hypothetical protein
LVRLEVVEKLAVLVGVVALPCCVPVGKAWHVAVLIIGYGGSRCGGRSCGTPLLATAATSTAVLSALTFFGKGCCHHVRCVLFLRWALPFVVVVPLSSILDGGCLQ